MINDNFPKITIVTVCYNSGKSIEATLNSVFNQSYKNIEYIIIDGDSSDNTLDILSRYKSKFGYFISEPDKGIYDAMNKALKVASGDWLYFLGSDDVLYSDNVIEELVGVFTDRDTIYYGDVMFKNLNIIYKFHLNKWNLCYRNISHQSLFYSKASYQNTLYDISFKVFADHIYNILLYGSRNYTFKHLDKIIALYNDEGFSSNTYDQKYYQKLPSVVYTSLGLIYAIYVQFRIKIFKIKKNIKRFEI